MSGVGRSGEKSLGKSGKIAGRERRSEICHRRFAAIGNLREKLLRNTIWKISAKEVLISPVFGVENLAEIAEAVSRSGLKVRLNLQLA